MDPLFTPSNITFTISMLAVLFAIYHYFKNPQTALDKRQALDKEEVENKAVILAMELESSKKESDRRFTEVSTRMDRALTLAENHTHTVDVKVDKVIEALNLLSIQVAKLETKIDERMPKNI